MARRRTGRHQQSARKYVYLILVLVATVVGAAALFAYLDSQRVEIDEITFCPSEEHIASHVAVLVDVTDSYSDVQKAFLIKFFDDLKRRIPVRSKLSIFSLDETHGEQLSPVVAKCKPPTGEDASFATANPAFLQEDWRNGFDLPLSQLLESLMEGGTSPESPIMAKIRAASVVAFPVDRSASGATPSLELVIVSDMLEHTSEYSQYGKGSLDFEQFRRSPRFARSRTDLRAVDVTILYVRRRGDTPESIQGRSHVDFWERWISSMDGELVRVRSVDG